MIRAVFLTGALISIVPPTISPSCCQPGKIVDVAWDEMTPRLTPAGGVCYFNNHKETYYNLPMQDVVGTAARNGIPGEYWEREDGCKMYGDYIIVAASYAVHPYGSTVETSLGMGIVLDTGGFASVNPTQLDLAVTW